MRVYVGGESALTILRYLRDIRDERIVEPETRMRSLSHAIHTKSQLNGLCSESLRLLTHADTPVQVIVPKKEHAKNCKEMAPRLWSHILPHNAFIKLTPDLYLSSAPFIFVQLARDLEPLELALLGMELCGLYSHTDPFSAATPVLDTEHNEVIFSREPATSIKRMSSFIDSVSWAPGIQNARRVVKWLADNSASPMETILYLLLTLPKMMGGYGLAKPTMNTKVRVATEKGRELRFPDLYWPQEGIDVEYNSDFAHTGDLARYRDSKRHVILTVNKIQVLPVTRAQIMNVDDFHDFAMGLRKMLGHRRRGYTRAWETKRNQLRHELLMLKK